MTDIIKESGSHFTPHVLAVFLAEKIISHFNFDMAKMPIKIMDPACGDGELLISISKKLKKKEFSLIGYDFNETYVNQTKMRLSQNEIKNFEIIKADFIEMAPHFEKNQLHLFNDQKKSRLYSFVDIIIANPPYVRTQILGSEKAKKLAEKFDLKGRIDLYYPFLISMTNCLKIGGIIGVLTSNRYLYTKSGESIRNFLIDNYEIIEVIDLGDTKFFNAAVLPAIFIGIKKSNNKPIQSKELKFSKIYETKSKSNTLKKEVNSIQEILKSDKEKIFELNGKSFKKSMGIIKFSPKKGDLWIMLNSSESKWVNTIGENSFCKIGDLFKVRVGVKTTADRVFIRNDWDALDSSIKPEDELLKELITHGNIDRWRRIKISNLKILYPHKIDNGEKSLVDLEKFPKAKKYLSQYRQKLESRAYLREAGRKWFEIWVPHNPALWYKPKLIFPDISVVSRFYFDKGGAIVNGNCYWIVAEKDEYINKLLLIQGVSNTNLMQKYHDLCFNNRLYSGRRRYFTQYVEKYPLPDIYSEEASEIVKITKKINDFSSQNKRISHLEEQLERLVAKTFKVPPVFSMD